MTCKFSHCVIGKQYTLTVSVVGYCKDCHALSSSNSFEGIYRGHGIGYKNQLSDIFEYVTPWHCECGSKITKWANKCDNEELSAWVHAMTGVPMFVEPPIVEYEREVEHAGEYDGQKKL